MQPKPIPGFQSTEDHGFWIITDTATLMISTLSQIVAMAKPDIQEASRPSLGSAGHEYPKRSESTRASYLELICHAPTVAALDPRVRLNLQQALLKFVKDETKWLALPPIEQRRLLKRLANRMGQTMYFSETLTLPCPNERGELVPTQVSLLLDATRNDNLSRIFDQIVNPEIAITFHQEFCFGLLELIDGLVILEEKVLTHRNADFMEGYLLSKILSESDVGLLPFSLEDLETIRESRVGIQIELIPRFLRLPLNRLYHAISSHSGDFPSLTLQFYLDRFFSTPVWKQRSEASSRREDYVRFLLAKSFYAVVRSGGLTMEQMELPQARRYCWSDHLTLRDDSSDSLDLEAIKAEQESRFKRLQERLELISQIENQVVTQRRALSGPLTMVELTYDQILYDAVNFCHEQESLQESMEEDSETSTCVWLPPLPIPDLPPDLTDLRAYLHEITDEPYLRRLPNGERETIEAWVSRVEAATTDPSIAKQLEALGETSERLQEDLLLLLASRHHGLVSQNVDTILSEISSHVTRMMHLGTVTPHVVVQQRYSLLEEKLLPFVYYVADPKEDSWLPSPYPYGTLLFAIQQTHERQGADVSLATQLLEELAAIEWQNLSDGDN